MLNALLWLFFFLNDPLLYVWQLPIPVFSLGDMWSQMTASFFGPAAHAANKNTKTHGRKRYPPPSPCTSLQTYVWMASVALTDRRDSKKRASGLWTTSIVGNFDLKITSWSGKCFSVALLGSQKFNLHCWICYYTRPWLFMGAIASKLLFPNWFTIFSYYK